jgi:hypothetical protein
MVTQEIGNKGVWFFGPGHLCGRVDVVVAWSQNGDAFLIYVACKVGGDMEQRLLDRGASKDGSGMRHPSTSKSSLILLEGCYARSLMQFFHDIPIASTNEKMVHCLQKRYPSPLTPATYITLQTTRDVLFPKE